MTYSAKRIGVFGDIFIYLILAMLFLIYAISQYVNLNSIALLFVFALIVWLVVYHLKVLLKYIFFFITALWNLIDVYALEASSQWVPNLATSSHYSGAFPLLAIGFFVFVIAISRFDSGFSKKDKESGRANHSEEKKKLYGIVTILSFFAVLAFIVYFSQTGYYATHAATRYAYQTTLDVLIVRSYTFLQLLIPVIAAFALQCGKLRIAIVYVLLYIVLLVLLGNKYGPLMTAAYILLLTSFFSQDHTDANARRTEIRVLAIFALFAVVLVAYSAAQMAYEHGSLSQGLNQLFNRIMNGQGDVWWGVYTFCGYNPAHLFEIGDELQAFNTDSILPSQYNFAIYKMMHLIAPDAIHYGYLDQGIRFAASTDASFYYYFGPLGVIVGKIIIALLLCWIVNSLISACKSRHLLEAILWTYLLTFSFRAFSMSELYVFASTSAIAVYMLILVMKWLRRSESYNTQPTVGYRNYLQSAKTLESTAKKNSVNDRS